VGAWAATPEGWRAFYDATRHFSPSGADAAADTPEVLAALLAAALAEAGLLTRGSLARVWRVLQNELTVYEALGGGDAPAPSPKEVERAFQEHRDALAALRTAERALDASAKRLEGLLKRVPPAPAPAVQPVAPAPQAYSAPPGNLPAVQVQQAPPEPPAPVRDATQDALKAILDRLERLEQRLAKMEELKK
jgi:hypothetical protein